MQLPKVTSTFTHYDTGFLLPNFKEHYFAVIPKFLIFVNGHSFEYSNSANWLSNKHNLKQEFFVFDEQRNLWVKNGNTLSEVNWLNKRTFPRGKLPIALKPSVSMSETDNLFALRCLLDDALLGVQYCDPDEFIKDLGYIDSLESIRKGEQVYRALKDTYRKLGYTENELQTLLEILSEKGIE